MNFVLKKGFVKERQDLHLFVTQVNSCIQTRRETENAATMASTVCNYTCLDLFIKIALDKEKKKIGRAHV